MAPTELTAVFADLHRFHEHLVAAVDARLAGEVNLTFARYEVLDVLDRLGTSRVNDIADDLGITWSGTSKIVDRLEAAQLCKRRPNPEDGRSSLIELTAAGRRSLAKARTTLTSELDGRVGSVLGQRPLDQLGSSLKRLRGAAATWAEQDTRTA